MTTEDLKHGLPLRNLRHCEMMLEQRAKRTYSLVPASSHDLPCAAATRQL